MMKINKKEIEQACIDQGGFFGVEGDWFYKGAVWAFSKKDCEIIKSVNAMSEIKILSSKPPVELVAWLPPSNFTGLAGLVGDHLYYWTDGCTQGSGDYPRSIKLPCEAEILGLSDQLSEEVCRELVLIGMDYHTIAYMNYQAGSDSMFKYPFDTAKESFASFLKANEVTDQVLILRSL